MIISKILNCTALGLLALSLGAQAPTPAGAFDQPDAQRTRRELSELLQHYPPSLRQVLALDPNLLANQPYMNPYPALASFVNAHPEIARNSAYYLGSFTSGRYAAELDRSTRMDLGRDIVKDGSNLFAGAMMLGLIVWLVRTLIDSRRWHSLSRAQNEVHTKILDRLNE